jgi:hypothetical protein
MKHTEAVLEINPSDSAVAIEKIFDVSLAGTTRDVATEYSTTAHCGLLEARQSFVCESTRLLAGMKITARKHCRSRLLTNNYRQIGGSQVRMGLGKRQ